MKKLSIFLLAVIAVISSCTIDNPVVAENGDLQFMAYVADDTRTTISGTAISWSEGDEIAITDGTNWAIYTAATSGANTLFSKKSGESLSTGSSVTYTAYYPSSIVGDGNSLSLPSSQDYSEGVIDGYPMKASAAGSDTPSSAVSLQFKSLCGVLKLDISSSEDITIDKVIVADGHGKGISGEFSASGNDAVLGENTSSYTVNLGEGLALSTTVKSFYIPVPAGSFEAGNLSFIVCTKSSGWRVYGNKSAITFNRAGIKSASLSIASTALKKYRVSNDTKQTWSYFISLGDALAAVTTGGSIDDCTIEMLGDDAPSETCTVTESKSYVFDGNGYAMDISSTSNTNAYQAVIFHDYNVANGTNVKFVNTIVDGKSAEAKDFRFFTLVGGGSVEVGKDFIAKNINTSLDGSALCIRGGKSSALTLKDGATITNCSAVNGGAIWSASYGKVYLNDCIIENCSASKTGGALCAHTITLKGSTIRNCSATTEGGALCTGTATSSSYKITIEDCLIENCSGTKGGAIRYGYVDMKGGTIKDCKASTQGGAISISAAAGTMKMSGGTIIGCSCTSTTGGGAIHSTGSGSKTLITGGTISGCSCSYGAGLCIGGGTGSVENLTITGCTYSSTVWRYGAGAYVASGTYTFANNDFSGNDSDYGCSIYLKSGNVTVTSGKYFSTSNHNGLYSKSSDATLTIEGGYFKAGGSMLNKDAGTVVANGGFFSKSVAAFVDDTHEEITTTDATALGYGCKYQVVSK